VVEAGARRKGARGGLFIGARGRERRGLASAGEEHNDDDNGCKENGHRAIWLNRFWCLMINITCGLMCLLVFVFVVHMMLKLLGPRH
jgi:hypothetical protein